MPKKKETRGRKKLYKTEAERKEAVNQSTYKWKKANTRCINVRFNLERDKEVLDHIDKQPNKADYIRRLILEDIKK